MSKCIHGHLWTPESTYVNPKGFKICRVCKNLRYKNKVALIRAMYKTCAQCGVPRYLGMKKYCTDCVPAEEPMRSLFINRINRYGVDKQMFDAMYFEQEGSCLLCEDEATDVDHCHTTGNVRGLLCQNCNTRLGHIENNTDWLHRALAYVEGG